MSRLIVKRRALVLALVAAIVCGGAVLAIGRRGAMDHEAPGQGQQPGGELGPATDQVPIRVVTSIFPLADIIASIGGRGVAASALLPAGASPHAYEMGPGQAKLLEGAELIVTVGGGLDLFVETLAGAAAPGVLRLELLPTVPSELLIPGSEGARPGSGGIDPHIWLDPFIVRDCLVPVLASALAQLRPAMTADISKAAETYRTRLTELDAWIRERLSGLDGKGLITIHPAWAYFGARYGLQAWAFQQQPGREPSPLWVMDLLKIAAERGIRTLFIEPQLARQAAEALVLEMGGQVLTLDPLGGPAVEGYTSFIELMRANVLTMERGLR